ncbi:MAG: hypothetical protein KC416_00105 [Myxococcales bacterium]|nr:hypothetical protein [Myxococcales bacterium]
MEGRTFLAVGVLGASLFGCAEGSEPVAMFEPFGPFVADGGGESNQVVDSDPDTTPDQDAGVHDGGPPPPPPTGPHAGGTLDLEWSEGTELAYNVDQIFVSELREKNTAIDLRFRMGTEFGGTFRIAGDGAVVVSSPLAVAGIEGACYTGSLADASQGMHCVRTDIPIEDGKSYKMRLWVLGAVDNDHWWGAWLIDEATATEYRIGTLRLPADRLGGVTTGFRYMGDAVDCAFLPEAQALFALPTTNGSKVTLSFKGLSEGACTVGRSAGASLAGGTARRLQQGP